MLSFAGTPKVDVLAGAKQPKPGPQFRGAIPCRAGARNGAKNSVSSRVCSEKKMKIYLTLIESVK